MEGLFFEQVAGAVRAPCSQFKKPYDILIQNLKVMTILFLGNIGATELIVLVGFFALVLVFFLGYYIGKDKAKK